MLLLFFMKILISNLNDKAILLRQYQVGNLYSSPRYRNVTQLNSYYALDNGAYSCYINKREFDDNVFKTFIENWFNRNMVKPRWIVVPDVVANRTKTIENYYRWEEYLSQYKVPLAFAVQDGMTKFDVPKTASVLFVGGSTEWKENTMKSWCGMSCYEWRDRKYNIHIARVNGWKRLMRSYELGTNSVDGTGYFKYGWDSQPAVDIRLFLKWQNAELNISFYHLKNLNPMMRRYHLNKLEGIFFNYEEMPIFSNEHP